MATVKIWPTERLDKALAYVMDPAKTENGHYVSGLNVPITDPETIYEDMLRTKEYYNKTSGRQGYHMEQSFKPGEITPALAHKIGVELAKQLFGDFEVVVATHTDKEHIHNHFVINSVSCIDGHKYHESNADYSDIQIASDRLCKKYGLSIVDEKEKGKNLSYAKMRHDEKNSRPTIHNLIYSDFDKAIERADTLTDFYETLKVMGYRVKLNGKYAAVAPEGKKFFRLYNFAKGYTENDVLDRIRENRMRRSSSPSHSEEEIRPAGRRIKKEPVYTPYAQINYGRWTSEKDFANCIYRLTMYLFRHYARRSIWQEYIQYRHLLILAQKERYPKYPDVDMRKELQKLNSFSRQAVLLTKNRIETKGQLEDYISGLEKEIYSVNKKKFYLKRKLKTTPDGPEATELEEKIEALEEKNRPLISDKYLAKEALKRCESIHERLNEQKEEALKQQMSFTRHNEEEKEKETVNEEKQIQQQKPEIKKERKESDIEL